MNESFKPSGAPYTLPEAAEYLGLSRGFLYKLTCTGRISFYKPAGGKIYFTKADLDGYLYRNRRAADYELAERAEAALIGGRR
jgi:excisionase family DNA binding protein